MTTATMMKAGLIGQRPHSIGHCKIGVKACRSMRRKLKSKPNEVCKLGSPFHLSRTISKRGEVFFIKTDEACKQVTAGGTLNRFADGNRTAYA